MSQHRRFTRIAALVVSIPTALVLASCSSSTSGEGSTSGSSSTSPSNTQTQTRPVEPTAGTGGSSSATTSSSTDTATPANGQQLAALMKQGLASIKTAHIEMKITAAGQTITGSGDEKLTNGKLTAMKMTEQIGSVGSLELIILADKVYVKLPSSLNNSGKPWQLVSENSSNPVLKQLASTLSSIRNSASLGSTAAFATAAQSVTPKGTEQIGGTAATHYSVVVDVTKLPDSYPGKSTLVQAGLSKLPVELWIDDQGRPVQVSQKLEVQGQSVTTEITVSKYNVPVTITAPPASQVSTS